MGQVKLLDCTLRDGGYVNDWNFGQDNLISVFERITDAGVDFIEIGFLDQRREFDINRSIMPSSDCVGKIYGGLDKKNTKVVGMIDFGTCDIENIKPQKESFLDGIRVIFKKHLRKEALEFCKKLKDLGYMVFSQLVSVTSYSDEEMEDLIRLANEIKPYAVSMVDTYGLMHQDKIMHYFGILDKYLDKSIGIGYHAHNNFQMGYANCIAFLSGDTSRTLVVDGSLYGMGKSAGNAPIELVAMYMNNFLDKRYNTSQMLEAIDANILQFYKPATWGYNMFYYLAASNDCHPSYVAYLMDKRTLSVSAVSEILKKLKCDKKLLYDKTLIEKLYADYQLNEVNDDKEREELKNLLSDKNIMLVGPGASIKTYKKEIKDYVKEHAPFIISINQIPEYLTPNYIFLSNSKRYVQLSSRLIKGKFDIIATSNVTGTDKNAFKFVLNFGSLIDRNTEIIDNSLVMLLKLLIGLNVKEVTLCGFDGYSEETSNYYNLDMEYDFVKNKVKYLNRYVKTFLDSVKDKISVKFITESKYSEN